ncbi:ABC transporter permease [Sulfidibacter corallicola]|uniref:ABC transporter permease n=1 Tax=Sulfidibacter corallicola TaxID=2818388 RepID=A0A8A4TPK1_SULCO|nr:ABC transporter permease [Sulfidibacter corallicola]QTD51002.1 ABC transporter permease [Sulfidibacter corallicola]
MLENLGRRTLAVMEGTGRYSTLVLRAFAAIFRRPFEWRELFKQLESVGVASFPVVAVTCIFTGMVFTLQTYDGFARFQAESYVPGILGVALLRELAPVLGGMMMAGRVGSAMAAELGTMRVTRQIDAMEVMATDPIQFLVVPRLLATTLMLPLLITLGDLIGLGGGWYLINHILNAPMPGFFDRVFEFLEPFDYWSGIVKSTVFGAIIASVGCYTGLNTQGGAEGVGKNTTAAVVNASLGILVTDFFLTKVLT